MLTSNGIFSLRFILPTDEKGVYFYMCRMRMSGWMFNVCRSITVAEYLGVFACLGLGSTETDNDIEV